MIMIVFIISIYIQNGSIYYILSISIMQAEDTSEKCFEEQMSAIVSAFVRDFPSKLQSASERKLILESVSYLLRNEERMHELIEYDINKSPSHSLFLVSQSQEDSEEQPASSHHNQSKDISKNQINMIHPSEHYEDSIFKHSYASSHSSDERDLETTVNLHTKNLKTIPIDRFLRRTERERKFKKFDDLIKMEESPPVYKRQSFISERNQAENEQEHSDTYEHLVTIKKTKEIWPTKTQEQQSEWDIPIKRIVKRKRGRKPEFPQMQQEIVRWIYSRISEGYRVTQVDIRNEASQIVKRLDLAKGSKFRASKGWMEKFFHRHKDIFSILSQQSRKRQPKDDDIDEE